MQYPSKRTSKSWMGLSALGLTGVLVGATAPAHADSKTGWELGYESSVFFEDGKRPDNASGTDSDPLKQRTNNSVSVEFEYFTRWADGTQSFTFIPFYRYDETDSERTHFDVREMLWHQVGDEYELKAGVGKVFWGVTESAHLVDIVNQTDAVEAIDGEDKLGQPMVQLMLEEDWGNLDLFLLPYHRERTFAGENTRLSTGLKKADALYEAKDEESNVDFAARWTSHLGELEYGLSYFHGTSREPTLGIKVNSDGSAELLPYYPLIQQFGLELQYLYEDWAFKMESIYRQGTPRNDVAFSGAKVGVYDQAAIPAFLLPASFAIGEEEDYYANVAGFEYTRVGIFDSRMDLGWVVEHLYDSRGDEASVAANEHDVLLATRWVFNDVDDSEILAGVFYDYEYEDYSLSVEANTRMFDSVTVELEARAFMIEDEENPQYDFRTEDFVKLSVAYFY